MPLRYLPPFDISTVEGIDVVDTSVDARGKEASQHPGALRAVAVAQIPEIMECHLVSGGFDYLLKLRAQDVEHYKTLLSDKIASLPWLRTSNTFVVLDEVVESHRLPLRAIEIRRRDPDE